MLSFRAAASGRNCRIHAPGPAPVPWLAALLCLVSFAATATDEATALGQEAGLDELVAYAEAHNPQLEAALHRWQAAEQEVPQAGALPDPQLGLGVVLDQVDASTEYMGERYSVSQAFPWFGKRGLRADAAAEGAHAERRRYEALRLALAEQVTAAWFEYAWVHEAAGTARANLDLVMRLEAIARALYRADAGSQADVSRAQVELGRLDDRLRSLLDQLGPRAARLNALLGRPAHARLPEPVAPSRQPVIALPERDDAAWLALAREWNPLLQAARHEIERERHGVALAEKSYYPDIRLGLEYAREGSGRMAAMDGGGADMLVGMISVNLPIRRGRLDAEMNEARSRLHAADRDARARELAVESELQAALFAYREGERKLRLYRGTLVPKARHALEATEAAYRAGNASFMDLIDSQRSLLEFELERERAAADRAVATARVRALAGVPSLASAQED
jgi:outer membrane protein TolC